MKRIASSILLITLISSSFFVAAQNNHLTHSNNSAYQHTTAVDTSLIQPAKMGQSAFAAIAEIVALLESDPKTDWSSVDIDALREHLVDMNSLILTAVVSKEVTAENVVFSITGPQAAQRAIKVMVPAHAQQLELIKQWDTSTEIQNNGVTLKLGSKNPSEIEKISNLGFFGLMAIGAHHQAHHLAMALGKAH